jgi:transcriptional regulator with XRE-family HTH domain
VDYNSEDLTSGGKVMPTTPLHFANRLQSLRERAGLSQYALAKLSGLSKQALSNLELGQREPNWNTVQRLATALSVSCDFFIDPVLVKRLVLPKSRSRRRKDTQIAPQPKRTQTRLRKAAK